MGRYVPLILQAIGTLKPEIDVNLLGTLAGVAKERMGNETVEEIMKVLVKSCGSENIEVVTEALNAFFDVFCDESYDQAFANAGILQMMSSGIESFRLKIMDCQEYEIKEHAQESFENLIEFMKYKAQHLA